MTWYNIFVASSGRCIKQWNVLCLHIKSATKNCMVSVNCFELFHKISLTDILTTPVLVFFCWIMQLTTLSFFRDWKWPWRNIHLVINWMNLLRQRMHKYTQNLWSYMMVCIICRKHKLEHEWSMPLLGFETKILREA